MSDSKIRKVFNDIVRGYGATKGWQVVLENGVATTTPNQPYLKTYLGPTQPRSSTLAGDHKAYLGVFQVVIVVPAGEGTGRVTTIIDELQALFPVYGRVSYGTNNVVIMTPIETLKGVTEGGTFSTPISFNYRSDIN
ncbi:phage tail terminator-like protein [Pseudomonas sp. P8_250]|uniref:phage tail terminator-like protein n=1 Tax=Pseudomonas sp. P8_250 TaxID=3043446 RepID=UPI002A35A4DB|nr:phage tail terminator-like protein [Pseudomonas sp. P8_250]MDX9668766.1 phage tail terminator-like protein [Pseudomonas sp. P8_250]